MENLIIGIQNALTIGPLIALIAGVTIGIFMGAIPGLTAAMAIALLAPITFGMQPITAIAFLIGIYNLYTMGVSSNFASSFYYVNEVFYTTFFSILIIIFLSSKIRSFASEIIGSVIK